MTRLVTIITNGSISLKEYAISALSSAADASGDSFAKYYDTIVPLLFQLISHSTGKEYRLLCGKTVECITLIGLGADKAKFTPHAHQLIAVMAQMQGTKIYTERQNL